MTTTHQPSYDAAGTRHHVVTTTSLRHSRHPRGGDRNDPLVTALARVAPAA